MLAGGNKEEEYDQIVPLKTSSIGNSPSMYSRKISVSVFWGKTS